MLIKGAGVLFVADKKVLFVRKRDTARFEFPGGHLEDGEDPAECAIREVKEETGFEIPANAKVKWSILTPFADGAGDYKTYCIILDKPFKPKIQKEEILSYEWLDAEEIPKYHLAPHTTVVLKRLYCDVAQLAEMIASGEVSSPAKIFNRYLFSMKIIGTGHAVRIGKGVPQAAKQDSENFKEEEHPRDEDGKFTSGGKSSFGRPASERSSDPDITSLYHSSGEKIEKLDPNYGYWGNNFFFGDWNNAQTPEEAHRYEIQIEDGDYRRANAFQYSEDYEKAQPVIDKFAEKYGISKEDAEDIISEEETGWEKFPDWWDSESDFDAQKATAEANQAVFGKDVVVCVADENGTAFIVNLEGKEDKIFYHPPGSENPEYD